MRTKYILTAAILLLTFLAGCNKTTPAEEKKETADNAEVEVTAYDVSVETPDSAPMSEEIYAIFVEDSVGTVMSYNEYWIDYTDYSVGIMLKADKSIKNLSILSLNWEGIKADVTPVYDETETVFCGDLDKGNGALIWISMPGDIPSYGISYNAPNGEEKRYTLTQSGKDGSLVLAEYE